MVNKALHRRIYLLKNNLLRLSVFCCSRKNKQNGCDVIDKGVFVKTYYIHYTKRFLRKKLLLFRNNSKENKVAIYTKKLETEKEIWLHCVSLHLSIDQ